MELKKGTRKMVLVTMLEASLASFLASSLPRMTRDLLNENGKG